MIYKENILRVLTFVLVLGSLLFAGCQTTGKADFNSMASDNIASFDGSRIAYDVRGEGDITIVFIHGWVCNSSFWRPQVEFFAADYRVVTIDLPGSGLSSLDRSEYSMDSFGKDVAAVVGKLGAEKIVLVGHSMGGASSVLIAFIHPLSIQKVTMSLRGLYRPLKAILWVLPRLWFVRCLHRLLIQSW